MHEDMSQNILVRYSLFESNNLGFGDFLVLVWTEWRPSLAAEGASGEREPNRGRAESKVCPTVYIVWYQWSNFD